MTNNTLDQLSTQSAPWVALESLDILWFQVSGTLCNLECNHCFISCSPTNKSYGYLSLEAVEEALQESIDLGVREYYFTGGEPFLNKELVPMLKRTLKIGPATVLTNGTVLKEEWLAELKVAEQASRYSLEFRVSIDGPTAERNDPIRGDRTFARAMEGVRKLCSFGFLPIITMTQTWDDSENDEILDQFRQQLRNVGCTRPRLKVLPRLKIGAEAQRTCGYETFERVTPEMLEDFDKRQLLCSHSRVVTDRGVAVCPILLESPQAILADSLQEADRPFPIDQGACYTCYLHGTICSNPSSLRESS